MKQPETSNALLTQAEAAVILGLKNAKTLAVWRCTDKYELPYVKYGRTVRYRRKDLEAFIEAKVVYKAPPKRSRMKP
jgi:excisionase family DNA binding protein